MNPKLHWNKYRWPFPSQWHKEVMVIPREIFVFEKLVLWEKILFYFMHKTKLFFLLVLTYSHSVGTPSEYLDWLVCKVHSQSMLSLNSSSRSSCLSFLCRYLFWLSEWIIEPSWLASYAWCRLFGFFAALFLNKFVFMSMCIHLNFMKTAVSLIASVLWPFLICN